MMTNMAETIDCNNRINVASMITTETFGENNQIIRLATNLAINTNFTTEKTLPK